MKNCPNCKSEMEDNFELCWNCNYSLTEQKIIDIKDYINSKRQINCMRCNAHMMYTGDYKFHEGPRLGFFGNIFEAFINRESFELYLCPKCGKVEFFAPLDNSNYKIE